MTVSSPLEVPPESRGLVREACACGIDVIAVSRSPGDITDAVMRHRVEPVHERWAALQGYRGPLAEQVALMQAADELAQATGRSALQPRFRGRPIGYRGAS